MYGALNSFAGTSQFSELLHKRPELRVWYRRTQRAVREHRGRRALDTGAGTGNVGASASSSRALAVASGDGDGVRAAKSSVGLWKRIRG